jgi:tetratricopeptide (TPR) repeat protein
VCKSRRNSERKLFFQKDQVLDNLIDESKERIDKIKLDKSFTEYTEEEAVDVLKIIDWVLKNKGFTYQRGILLNTGLKTKKIDCDDNSIIYLGIADVLNLPFKLVEVPHHAFVRWHFDEDNYFNWETTCSSKRLDYIYKSKYGIPEISIKKGVYLKSLNTKETYSIVYGNKGLALFMAERDKEAIKALNKSLELNPKSVLAYGVKGDSLCYLRKYDKAIGCYNKMLELHPKHAFALKRRKYAIRKKVYNNLLKKLLKELLP